MRHFKYFIGCLLCLLGFVPLVVLAAEDDATITTEITAQANTGGQTGTAGTTVSTGRQAVNVNINTSVNGQQAEPIVITLDSQGGPTSTRLTVTPDGSRQLEIGIEGVGIRAHVVSDSNSAAPIGTASGTAQLAAQAETKVSFSIFNFIQNLFEKFFRLFRR